MGTRQAVPPNTKAEEMKEAFGGHHTLAWTGHPLQSRMSSIIGNKRVDLFPNGFGIT